MMTAEEAAEWGKTLNFEKVWAAITATDRQMAENARQMAENDRKVAEARAEAEKKYEEVRAENARLIAEAEKKATEARAEADRQRAETDRQIAETDRQIKEMVKTVDRVTKNVGCLNRSMGALIETLIAARLWEKFPQYNLSHAYQRIPIYDEKNVEKTDVDILLVNSTLCIAVEVKHELNHERDVDHHIKRMELVRQYPPEQVQGKQLLGALAGGVVDPNTKNYAYRAGFFVLGLAGESVCLIPPPEGFQPKAW